MLDCPTGLLWDQNSGRCEFISTTCNAGEVEKTTTTTTPTTTTPQGKSALISLYFHITSTVP